MKDEAMKLALEAAYLAGFNASGEGYNGEYGIDCPEENAIWKKDRDNEITVIKQALAAPVQPVGKVNELFDEAVIEQCGFDRELLVYTTPPAAKRQWVGLTDEEISDIAINNPPMVHEFARAIEAKLKEKNGL